MLCCAQGRCITCGSPMIQRTPRRPSDEGHRSCIHSTIHLSLRLPNFLCSLEASCRVSFDSKHVKVQRYESSIVTTNAKEGCDEMHGGCKLVECDVSHTVAAQRLPK